MSRKAKLSKNEQAYMDGISHYFQEWTIDANPYVSREEMRHWERGWTDARDDEELGWPRPGKQEIYLPPQHKKGSGFRRGTLASQDAPVLYAGYGANTNKGSMRHRCPSAEYVGTGVIKGWRLEFRGVADIVPAWGYDCEVSLWLIDAEVERSLDRFEGFPSMYQKTWVPVFEGGKTPQVALAYVMRVRNGLALPFVSYEECLREGYTECGMNPQQIDEAIDRASKHGNAPVKSSWAKK